MSEFEHGEAPIAFHAPTRKGRGAQVTPGVRFEQHSRELVDDGWSDGAAQADALEVAGRSVKTIVMPQKAKSIIARNQSPDVPFNQSVNPYYGCEHGCAYCYARPSYAYWGLSPGLDFETRLFAKTNAAELLRSELSRRGYVCETLALGANTDCYQPIEREWKITRSVLEVCAEFNQPVGIVTKSALVERDIDLLAPMAAKGLAKVYVSIATLDGEVARTLEPRAAAPARRLEAIRALAGAGIPVGVLTAPMIPMVNDSGMEKALEAAWEAGAREASYIVLRLPHELREIFRDWLERHMPLRAEHVMSLIRQMRGGEENDPRFGARMKGEGLFAQLIAQRFEKACARLGFNAREWSLDCSRFRVPGGVPPRQSRHMRAGQDSGPQMNLF